MSCLLRFENLGHSVALRVDDASLQPLADEFHSAARVQRLECSASTPAEIVWQASPGGGWQILLRDTPWGNADMAADLVYLHSDGLLDDLFREQCDDAPLLHAGAAVSPAGQGVVFCGPSGAGKSSLVLACIQKGWNWLTDEWLCFRSEKAVWAEGFRRNFNLKQRSFEHFPILNCNGVSREFLLSGSGKRIRFLNPGSLGGNHCTTGAAMQLVVFPQYNADTVTPALEKLEGLMLMNRIAPELRSSTPRMFTWLGDFTSRVSACTVRYRNPHDVPAMLEKWFESEP